LVNLRIYFYPDVLGVFPEVVGKYGILVQFSLLPRDQWNSGAVFSITKGSTASGGCEFGNFFAVGHFVEKVQDPTRDPIFMGDFKRNN